MKTPKLTREHFEFIADILATANAAGNEKTCDLIYYFADRLAETNPRFDRPKFISKSSLNPVLR